MRCKQHKILGLKFARGCRVIGLPHADIIHRYDGQPLPIIQQDIAGGPDKPVSTLGIATAGLYRRYLKGQKPVAMVSTDNAAMIGAVAHYRMLVDGPGALDFDVEPNLALAVE